MANARIAVVDDHSLFAQAISLVLRSGGAEVTVHPPALDIPDRLAGQDVDLLLLDLALGDGLTALDLLPDVVRLVGRVLVLTGETSVVSWGNCLLAGAHGVVPKTLSIEEISALIAGLSRGDAVPEAYRDHRWSDAARRAAREQTATMEPFDALTRREQSVLNALVEGESAADIARDAYVSEATVRSQIQSVLHKLGVRSQLQAVARARRAGWVSPGATS
ncbi:MAG: LuxR C-terminal-related transcriptional regulator [Nocardioidaceae bacterium]